MEKGTVLTCAGTLTLGGGGGAGITYYVKTKDFKESEVQEVTQYVFNRESLKWLNDKDEDLQKWMLLAMSFLCLDGSSEFDTYSYKFFDNTTNSNIPKIAGYLKVGSESSDKKEEAKKLIKEFLDSTDKTNVGGIEVRVCKDVRDTVYSNQSLLEGFNVEIKARDNIEFKE